MAPAFSIREEPTFGVQLVINVQLILENHSVYLTLVFERVILNYPFYQGLLVPHSFGGDRHVIIQELEGMINER